MTWLSFFFALSGRVKLWAVGAAVFVVAVSGAFLKGWTSAKASARNKALRRQVDLYKARDGIERETRSQDDEELVDRLTGKDK